MDLEGDVWVGGGKGGLHHVGLDDGEGGFARADVEGCSGWFLARGFGGDLGGGVERGVGGGRGELFMGCHFGGRDWVGSVGLEELGYRLERRYGG